MRIGVCAVAALMLAGCSVSSEVTVNVSADNDTENVAEPAPVENASPILVNSEAVPEFDPETYPELQGLPPEVLRVIDRRIGCEHWAGEPGWDAARQKQIDAAVAELCPGIDKAILDLRAKYATIPRLSQL